MSRKQMSGADIHKMLRMYEKGANAKEIGEAINRTPSVVGATLCRMRKQINSRDLPQEAKQKMQEIQDEFTELWTEAKRDKQKAKTLFARLFPFVGPRN